MADDKSFLDDSRRYFNLSDQLRSTIPDARVIASSWDFTSPFWSVWRLISDQPDRIPVDIAKNTDFEGRSDPYSWLLSGDYVYRTGTGFHVPSVEEIHDPTVRKFDRLIPLHIEYVGEGLHRVKLFQGNRYSVGDSYVFSGNNFFIGQSFTTQYNVSGVCQIFTLIDGSLGNFFNLFSYLTTGQRFRIINGAIGNVFDIRGINSAGQNFNVNNSAIGNVFYIVNNSKGQIFYVFDSTGNYFNVNGVTALGQMFDVKNYGIGNMFDLFSSNVTGQKFKIVFSTGNIFDVDEGIGQRFILKDHGIGNIFDLSDRGLIGQDFYLTSCRYSVGQMFLHSDSTFSNIQLMSLMSDDETACFYFLGPDVGKNSMTNYVTTMLCFFTYNMPPPNASGRFVISPRQYEPWRSFITMVIREVDTPTSGIMGAHTGSQCTGYGFRWHSGGAFAPNFTPFLVSGNHGTIRISGDMWGRDDPNYNVPNQLGLIMLHAYISNTISFDFMNVRKVTSLGGFVEALVVRVDGQLRAIPLYALGSGTG